MRRFLCSAMAVVGLASWVSCSFADIVTPVAVFPTSEFAAAINLINGSGLDGIGPVEDQAHDNDENNMWQTFSDPVVGESVEFLLDTRYDLSSALIWQYNGPDGFGTPRPDREVDEIEISVSPTKTAPFTSVGNFNLDPAFDQQSPLGELAQVFTLTGADVVRRVKIEIRSLHPDQGIPNGGDLGGFSEVRFDGSIVPEPAGLALAGLGAVAVLRRLGRRRKG